MRLWLALPITAFLTVTLAYAEAPATGTGTLSKTGSGSSPSVDPWVTERANRADLLRKNLAPHLKRENQWQMKQAEYLQKRTGHRVSCRAEMRQANRDTKLPTLLRCFRGELTMEREKLRQEREYAAQTLGIGDALRAAATKKIDLLRDAINTITFAIDSGVYGTQEAVASARQKLHLNYRAKLDGLRTLVRAEHALSWDALLLTDLDKQTTGTGSVALKNDCLTVQETALRTIVSQGTGSTVKLTDVLTGLSRCVQDLRIPMGSGGTTVDMAD